MSRKLQTERLVEGQAQSDVMQSRNYIHKPTGNCGARRETASSKTYVGVDVNPNCRHGTSA